MTPTQHNEAVNKASDRKSFDKLRAVAEVLRVLNDMKEVKK